MKCSPKYCENFHITATSKNNYFRIYKILRHTAEAAIATHCEDICVGNKHDADSKKRKGKCIPELKSSNMLLVAYLKMEMF